MIKDIVLPDLGEGIESATISEVPLGVGEQVKKDDVLLVLESDKASMEIPSDYDGKIIEVLIKEGEDVATGETLFKVETQDGLEMNFAVNHLAPMLLTLELLPLLRTTSSSRIINTSSGAHRRDILHFDDLEFRHTTYNGILTYSQSKLCNILF